MHPSKSSALSQMRDCTYSKDSLGMRHVRLRTGTLTSRLRENALSPLVIKITNMGKI
jgi:hypothetical protein